MKLRKAALAGIYAMGLAAAHAQSPADEPEAVSADEFAVTVIELGYANAEEVAALLTQVLPRSVKVVPYYATNSLVVSGDRETIRALFGDEAEIGNGAGTGDDASDAPSSAPIGSITARVR